MANKGKWYNNMIDKYLVEFLSSDWKSAKSCVEFIISEGNTNVPNANAMSSYLKRHPKVKSRYSTPWSHDRLYRWDS
jgi:hypothetical protein